MRDFQAIADRVEMEALRDEFKDAAMVCNYDDLTSLFTGDGAWRMPYVSAEFIGREQIGVAIERARESVWDYLNQCVRAGTTELDGDAATGRTYISELGTTPLSGAPPALLAAERSGG